MVVVLTLMSARVAGGHGGLCGHALCEPGGARTRRPTSCQCDLTSKGLVTGSPLGLETACVKWPREGSGHSEANVGVLKRGQAIFRSCFTLARCQQTAGREVFSRWVKRCEQGSSPANQHSLFLSFAGDVRTQRRACSKKAFKRSLPTIKSLFSFS